MKAAKYVRGNPQIEGAFVSTNSIVQGEQPAILWSALGKEGFIVNFAHKTFRWTNEGKGVAGVSCVIVGFGGHDRKQKFLLEQTGSGAVAKTNVSQINGYLLDAPPVFITPRLTPLCDVPPIMFGNMPNDGGNYLFTPQQKASFLAHEPLAERFFRRFVGATELLNGVERYCLWLKDATPTELRGMPKVMERIAKVRALRLASTAEPTRQAGLRAHEFFNLPQPETGRYIVVPLVSSENRDYIPLDFLPCTVVASNLVSIIPGAGMYEFGVLSSRTHMAWVRTVCGRLESRYRYSNSIVYNNFVWAREVSSSQRCAIDRTAQAILDTRAKHNGSTLADLYDPLTMPVDLRRAHEANDKAVDKAYSYKGGDDDASRAAFLFKLYEQATSLLPSEKPAAKSRVRKGKTVEL
jgi:hypothetical protein